MSPEHSDDDIHTASAKPNRDDDEQYSESTLTRTEFFKVEEGIREKTPSSSEILSPTTHKLLIAPQHTQKPKADHSQTQTQTQPEHPN
jgi:hypothetical protein